MSTCTPTHWGNLASSVKLVTNESFVKPNKAAAVTAAEAAGAGAVGVDRGGEADDDDDDDAGGGAEEYPAGGADEGSTLASGGSAGVILDVAE